MALYKMTKDLRGSFDATPYLDAGIHENCKLDRVEYGKSDKGNEFVAFYFKNPSGSQVSKTEWPVRLPEPLTKLSPEAYAADTSSEKNMYESMIANQMARIKHICVDSGFVSEDSFTFEVNTFEEFAKAIISLLGESYKDKLVRIKVIYDRNNFTSLPSYTRYVWIEPMTVSIEESKMRILSIDKMERVHADNEANTPNPFANSSTNANTPGTSKEDLPF